MMCRDLNSMFYTPETDTLIIHQRKVEEATEPACKFHDVCPGLVRGELDDLVEHHQCFCGLC
jgi:hypothetical protein